MTSQAAPESALDSCARGDASVLDSPLSGWHEVAHAVLVRPTSNILHP
jgi:hypothetical protein